MSAVPNLPEQARSQAPNGSSNGVRNPFVLRDLPVDYSRKLRVIVIGAGFSGIYCGIRIPERIRNVDLTIYEKNAGVGGTWWENRYLGCACDVPSHSYQYTFEPNPNWSALYAPAAEIQAYLAGVAKKYSSDRFIKLSHQITECKWDVSTAKWHVTVKNLATGEIIHDKADVLVSARGNLNNPAWPEIDGLNKFKGELMHSAAWNENYDFSNKRIGVIGSGSSSIQIVPSLQRIPGTHVSTFVRSKTWISPSWGQQVWDQYGLEGFSIPKELQEKFKNDPEHFYKFRLAVEEDGNSIHAVTIKGTPMQQGAKQVFADSMKERLANAPKIFDFLLPSFSPGCRRLTPGPGYLEALTQPNVDFVTNAITRISENAIHTEDGKTHELDALVCATGFHTSAPPPFDIVGLDSLPIHKKWEDRAVNYLSHSVSGYPNLFMMMGPNSAIGSGSLTMMIQSVGDYIVKAIRKIQKENIASMAVKKEREDDFTEYVDAYFEKTVFSEECRSWYKNKKTGEVVGLWPGSMQHCMESMRAPRWEDYEYTYADEVEEEGDGDVIDGVDAGLKRKRKDSTQFPLKKTNQLAFLGNGWTVNLMEGTHPAWYLYPEFQEIPKAPKPEENEEFKVRPFSH